MQVTRAAPAKLNLFLEVLARRPDGYHEIDSVFAALDLHDTVELERAAETSLEVVGPDGDPAPGVPADPTNLVWRAARALDAPARIRLVKRIPPGAGLGGGSSDAAAVLHGLDELYGLGLGRDGLRDAARALGADVSFFLSGGFARCRGIGDRVEPLAAQGRRYLLLLPELVVPTAAVYAALGSGLTGNRETATVFLDRYRENDGSTAPPYFNRLQAAAARVEPRLTGVRREAEKRYGRPFFLTGSGAAWFAEASEEDLPADEFTAGGVRVAMRSVATLAC